MDLVKLTEEIVKSVAENPDDISVKQFETESADFVLIEVLVSQDDMPRIIGREGKMANAIRTVVSASGRLNNKKVKINIDSF